MKVFEWRLRLSDLLLLATFLKHYGNTYEQSGVQLKAWPVLGLLWMAAQLIKASVVFFSF